MVDNKVEATLRQNFGKGAARKLRAIGRVPAVLYGHHSDPRHLDLPAHEMSLILRQSNALIELTIDGEKVLGLVKDVQKDPVRQIIEHIDLLLVKRGEKVQVEIPIIVEGEPVPGTLVSQDLNHLYIEAEATNIPNSVTVVVEGLEEGTQIHAGSVELPKGSTLLGDPEELVLNIVIPAAPSLDDEEDADVGEDAEETEESAEEESDE